MRILLCALALSLAGCGSAPEAVQKSAPEPPPVKDRTSLLPLNNRVGTHVVKDHLFGQPKLPGGTVGDYKAGGKEFQLFIVDADDNPAAAFLLLDAKAPMRNPEYIAYMGGYFGSDGTRPLYVFAKLHYLAGVYGLPKDEADPIARVLASHLH